MMALHANMQAQATACAVMVAVSQASYQMVVNAIVSFNRLDDLARMIVTTLGLACDHDRHAATHAMQGVADRLVRGQRLVRRQYQCIAGVDHLANMEQSQAFNVAVPDFPLARSPDRGGI